MIGSAAMRAGLTAMLLVAAPLIEIRAAPMLGADTGGLFRVDVGWPLPLPDKWLLGAVGGVAVDRHDHVWIVQRPGTVRPTDLLAGAKCCVAAPPVIEFDSDGRVVRSWGGTSTMRDWFDSEHAIFVDDEDHVWILGAGGSDGLLVKFTADGKPLLRIGRKGRFAAGDDTSILGAPTDIYVDAKRREVYVSDGYRNHRVIVFDADTGAFKRQWTAFGLKVDPKYVTEPGSPDYSRQGPQPNRFTTVHCVTMIADEVFVCDRANDRIQVFTREGMFVRELFFNKGQAGPVGSTWDAAPVPGANDRLLVLDGINSEMAYVDAKRGQLTSGYLAKGRYAGQMHWPHQLAIDSKGQVYVAEVDTGMRVQRFVPSPPPPPQPIVDRP